MAKGKRGTPQVFLSHTKSDKSFVRRLASDLEALGFAVWLDEWDVLYGGWWMDFEEIDEPQVLAKRKPIPYAWEFVRLRNLKMEHAPKEESDSAG